MRPFTFPRVNCAKAGAHLKNEILKISEIGEIPVIIHRNIPEGFMLKTATLVKKADGYYVCVSTEDETVPSLKPINTNGTDLSSDRTLSKTW